MSGADSRSLASELLGQEVEVVLSHGDEREPSVIARGKLLAWDDFGECQLLDEMGAVHHCWPMLDVRPLSFDEPEAD